MGTPRLQQKIADYKLPSLALIPELLPYYSIEFKGRKIERKYNDIIKEIQRENDLLRCSVLGINPEEM